VTLVLDASELAARLTSAVTAQGLELRPIGMAEAQSALAGPVLVVRIPVRADARLELAAVVDSALEGGDRVVQALAQAAAGSLGELVDGDASMDAVASLAEAAGRFTTPPEAGLVLGGGAPMGLLVWSVDRREAMAEPEPATGAPAHLVTHHTGVPAVAGGPGMGGMHLLRDVQLDVSVELGRTVMTVAEVLELSVGSVVELDRAARAPVDIRVNGTLLAKGEVVVIDDEYAVRVTQILDPARGAAQ
jgi:flagellar motor switch protein FliN